MESMPHSLHRIKSSLWLKQGYTGQGHPILPNIRWQEVEWKKNLEIEKTALAERSDLLIWTL